MGSADPLHTLERSAITPLVRRATHSPMVEVSDWSVYPIHSGDGEGLGVYRFVGTGEDRGQKVGGRSSSRRSEHLPKVGRRATGTTGSGRPWPPASSSSRGYSCAAVSRGRGASRWDRSVVARRRCDHE